MDLITWQEAAARLHDESLVVAAEIEQLENAGASLPQRQQESLDAARKRLDALHRVAERLSGQRPPNDVDRYPNLPGDLPKEQ
ncbi:MAG: hypothetical protein ACJ71Z_08450 [Aeromicrobium sp.]